MAKLVAKIPTLVRVPTPRAFEIHEVPVDVYEVGFETPFGVLESLEVARQACERCDLDPDLNIEVVVVARNRETGAYRVLN